MFSSMAPNAAAVAAAPVCKEEKWGQKGRRERREGEPRLGKGETRGGEREITAAAAAAASAASIPFCFQRCFSRRMEESPKG